MNKAILILIAAITALSGCSGTSKPKPNQEAQYCVSLDGSDEFVVDPNHEGTHGVRELLTTTAMVFIDSLTGERRVVTNDSMVNYKCKAHSEVTEELLDRR